MIKTLAINIKAGTKELKTMGGDQSMTKCLPLMIKLRLKPQISLNHSISTQKIEKLYQKERNDSGKSGGFVSSTETPRMQKWFKSKTETTLR